ncbi:hypothetical protein R1sor_019469 [Riccia sorocarpa]|uniref:N-acetylglucosaminyl transferase component n=1 Tax=Riccia sorocarpa TaxID=122646 RepID=A0ABD3ICR5_9MARC
MAKAKRTLEHCRVWLPQQLCILPKEKRLLLMVGWVSEGVDFIDLVIAAGVPTLDDCSVDVAGLQRCLESAESKLPAGLRKERKLCVIGEYHTFREYGDQENRSEAVDASAESKYLQDDQRLLSSLRSIHRANRFWAVFMGNKCCGRGKNLNRVPTLYRVIQDDSHVAPLNTHIILYNQPKLGSHYYSCVPWTSAHQHSSSVQLSADRRVKKPIWLSTLEERKTPQDIDAIMMELNCASFVDQKVQEGTATSTQSGRKHAVQVARIHSKKMIAPLITVWATFLYCIARSLLPLLALPPTKVPLLPDLMEKSMLLQIMRIRSRQLMAWPFLLRWGGLGPEQPNVSKADTVAVPKHSTSVGLLIDKIAGVIVGSLVLSYHSRILRFLMDFGGNLTNDVLRTGCVWLMGVPAGFKINTELAAVFGTLSLHWIQTWSTLLVTSVPAIKVLLVVMGLCGIVMGFTVLAALVADVVSLSTIHVLTLHDAISFIYSNQLRALAALFRLFRGRKRNVLRGRLDSFDCSVEQLLVGSLMFTPLLLLLPTTSVYYTFFSIIFMMISSIRLTIQYVVSIFLSFPFYEVIIWLLHPKRFPSGVWLRMVQLEARMNEKPCTVEQGCQQYSLGTVSLLEKSLSAGSDTESDIRNGRVGSENGKDTKQSMTLLSELQIRSASVGELLKPFIATHYSSLRWSPVATVAYKIVSGERYGSRIESVLSFLC